MASTATTTKKSSKKTSPKPPASKPAVLKQDDLEPLGPTFLDDEDDEEVDLKPADPMAPLDSEPEVEDDDEDDDAAPPVARNVGSVLSGSAPKPVVQGPPTKGQRPHAAALYWEEAKRIGPAHAKATLLRKLSERISTHYAETAKWGDAKEVQSALAFLNEANDKLTSAVAALTALPVGWTPPARTSTGGAPKTLPEGAKVSIKESARKDYEGALEAAEMTGLTVFKHEEGKSKVVCKTAEGSRVVISRAHLALDPTPAKVETAEN